MKATECDAVNEVVVRVRSTGGDNLARVLGHGVTASCTSSAMEAAARAAGKFFGPDTYVMGMAMETGKQCVTEFRARRARVVFQRISEGKGL